IRNLQVYFARKRWPESSAEAQAFREKYTAGLVAWTRNLYDSVQNYVLSEGRNLIGERDVQAFLKNEMPTRANLYEDIIFFPNLGRDQQITIESYDIDAFRDSGVHWRYLEFAFKDLGPKVLLPADPFALELISEAIANAGVLMFRLAGERGERAERLAEADLDYAFTKMIELRDIGNAGILEAKSSLQPEIASAESAPPSMVLFRDITESSGIRAHHRSSDWLSRQIRSYLQKGESTGVITLPPAFGGAGVAAGDFDSDGDADLLILSGLGNFLYRNNRDGTFTDITDQSGINWKRSDGLPGEPRQPLVADLDNDGDQDVIITYVNDPHRVFRNDGNGRFEDVSDRANLGGSGLVAGPATLLDIDNDGLLDLYITYFGNYLGGVLPTLA
ncbi:MAG: VCBS repeat-containing protein, partial [Gammaproteobacteria bacterium]|nr:VCBS repeat-containing protein [Gammaproteobacteria bacterium]